MFSACCFRLGSKLPPGVSQPPQFAKRPWETQPQSRGMSEPPAWSQHHSQSAGGRPLNHIPTIRNPKLRQYYLQGSPAACHRVTWGACGRDPLEMCLFILLESHAGPASMSAAAVEMSHVEREDRQFCNIVAKSRDHPPCFCASVSSWDATVSTLSPTFRDFLGSKQCCGKAQAHGRSFSWQQQRRHSESQLLLFFVSSHNFTAILNAPRISHLAVRKGVERRSEVHRNRHAGTFLHGQVSSVVWIWSRRMTLQLWVVKVVG